MSGKEMGQKSKLKSFTHAASIFLAEKAALWGTAKLAAKSALEQGIYAPVGTAGSTLEYAEGMTILSDRLKPISTTESSPINLNNFLLLTHILSSSIKFDHNLSSDDPTLEHSTSHPSIIVRSAAKVDKFTRLDHPLLGKIDKAWDVLSLAIIHSLPDILATLPIAIQDLANGGEHRIMSSLIVTLGTLGLLETLGDFGKIAAKAIELPAIARFKNKQRIQGSTPKTKFRAMTSKQAADTKKLLTHKDRKSLRAIWLNEAREKIADEEFVPNTKKRIKDAQDKLNEISARIPTNSQEVEVKD